MDIFNRPPSIAEDTLQYVIYPSANSSDKTSATSLAACIKSYAVTLLPDFLWHRDAFEVKLVSNPDRAGSWILEGRMRVGDSVDDEWCTVWLLKEMSSKWDVAISVYDSDGDFLLIEAAEALPSWVKPSNSENRVWIHNSRLHLVPLTHISPSSRERRRRKLPALLESDDEDTGDRDAYIAAEDAVNLARDPSTDTLAPVMVERLVWQRIAEYPDAAKSHIHTTKAFVPEDIAKVLAVNPALVQRAVEAFYTRDAIQLRAAHRMSRFPPSTCVLPAIKMTRTAYAQLMGQKFFPPKIFGQWKESDGTKEWKWRDVGMKIAVGFEMLYQESKGRLSGQNLSEEGIRSAAAASKDALHRDSEYQKYVQNLTASSYFKGELQGSQRWNLLENEAAATFVEVRRSNDASRQSFAAQVTSALANIQTLPDQSTVTEDSDDWLHVNAEDFDRILEATIGNTNRVAQRDPRAMDVDNANDVELAEDQLASEQAKRLKDLATKVENFVEGEGGLEGALFDDEELSDEPFTDEESESESESENESEESKRLDERKDAMDKLVPGLGVSDYGKMPASYHSNSQRVAPATLETNEVEDNAVIQTSQEDIKAEEQPQARRIRPPIIPRDRYEGVDSDDETDEELVDDDESEEDHPQVVGEIEIDMEEEEEEFLEFSRQALGISDEQWLSIVKDRKDRGAFLPKSAKNSVPMLKRPVEGTRMTPKKNHIPRVPEPGPRPNVNPELDSFEAVMKALDEALSNSKSPSWRPPQSASKGKEEEAKATKDKGKGQSTVEDAMDVDKDEDFDIDSAMEAELKQALEGADSDSEEPMDYNMIKNFLESFKSQAGLSGPVSNLAGRLQPDLKFPRDDSF